MNTSRSLRIALAAAAVLALALAATGCGDDESSTDTEQEPDDDSAVDDDADDDGADDDIDDDADGGATVVIPPLPYWPNDVFWIDEDLIASAGNDTCIGEASPDNVDFWLSRLILNSLDDLCSAQAAYGPRVGASYLSGYFGGLWLRDSLDGFDSGDADRDAFDALRPIFGLLVEFLAARESAASADPLTSAKQAVPLFLILYGYNRGYLEQVQENPPVGIDQQPVVECGDEVLDCVFPGYEQDFVTRFNDALDKLADPPNERWAWAASQLPLAESAVEQGRDVWNAIPLDELDEAGYRRLLDLSADFLAATRAAMMGHMSAWGDESPDDAACSMPLEAGMLAWAGSYFLGLASPAPAGTFPTLICGE